MMKFALLMAVVVLSMFAGLQVVPVLFNNFQFQDAVKQAALYGAYHQQSEAEISQNLQQKAHALGLPVDSQQIQVYHNEDGLVVDVEYNVQVPLPLHSVRLHFRDHSVQQTASWY